jgi:hypothetical protein
MRGFQEFKGQSTRLDYNRERGEFVARPVPHPFVVRSAASEVKTAPTESVGSSGIAAPNRPRARADKVPSIFAPARPFPASMKPNSQQDPSRNAPLAGYEDSMRASAIVGLALAAIVVWVGFVVS